MRPVKTRYSRRDNYRDSYRYSHRGFTLIEVVIALTLLSLLMLATITAMRTLADSQTRIVQISQQVDESRIVSSLLRSLISQAIPVVRVRPGEGYGAYFRGMPQELLWVAPMSGYQGPGGLHVMRLSLSDQQALLLQFQPYQGPQSEPDWAMVEPAILLEDVTAFELEYRFALNTDWLQEWDWSQYAPTHVRLGIEQEGRRWSDLTLVLGPPEVRL
ncbi:prepilin-type N-terminal cleavage/methylation domain-containing protein [Nitrincola sp. MINF-07-Sa-05]|uniref:prepilin-type N-terminal cleavage/methylation domain-containing protein n=1 Tax=Nitrincola salilacus TaxID=3400273 RepID=UPI003918488A